MPWRHSSRRRYRGDGGTGIRTNPPTEAALLISAILWLLGFADLVLGIVNLPNNLGLWALVLAGFIMILASVVWGL